MIFAFCLLSFAQPQDLIDRLNADSIEEREEAEKKLEALGKAAIPGLEKLAAKGISLADVDNALVGNNSRIPVGQLNGPTRTYTLESKGQLYKRQCVQSLLPAGIYQRRQQAV